MKILGRQSNLSRLLETSCQEIASLDAKRDGPAMLDQIYRARPDLKQRMGSAIRGSRSQEAVSKSLGTAMGAAVVSFIKEIPKQIDTLVKRVNDRSTAPALRCALVGVLAYVVQPRDLVPDDAPGGYGFVDDHALLTATTLQLTEDTRANSQRIDEMKKRLACLESVLAVSVGSALTLAIQGQVLLFQSLSLLPTEVAGSMTQRLLDDPNSAVPPPAPPGWQAPSFSPRGAGHWSGGAYFEGDDVVMPGGPSLIGGRVFIPD